jgi:transcriptional regulator with XRE-family HTH domain
MIRSLLITLPLVVLWATVVGKLPALRRDPTNGALRAYWVAVLAVALAWTVLQPPVHLALDRMTGVANLARLLGHSLAVVAACAGQAFLAYSSLPEPAARSRVHRQVWVAAGALAAMGILFALGRVHYETLDFIGRYGTTPPILAYWLVFLTYLGVSQVEVIRLAWRWARYSDRLIIQLAGRMVAVGGLFVCGYIVYDLLFLAASRLGRAYLLGNQPLITRSLLTTAILIGTVGSTMPAWGPRVGLPRLLLWASHYRANQRLYPLWRRLCEAVPEIALVPPSPRWRDVLAVRDLNFRLHGRVGEIQDGLLRLRPYLDRQPAAAVEERCRQAGLDGVPQRVIVEATSLATAAHAKERAELGRRLQELRQARAGLTGDGLAQRLGVSGSKVDLIETGALIPLREELALWIQETGVPGEVSAELLARRQRLEGEYRRWQSADRAARRPPVTREGAAPALRGGPDLQHESTDLPHEITWLVRIATAYTHSPLVGVLAGRQEHARRAALQQEVSDQP